jgi:thymidylate synthase ThyX
VFDHVKLTFEFSNIPKILAMILNNEKDYATSEKSARYTEFRDLSERERKLYDKWLNILIPIIHKKYPNLYDDTAKNPMLKIKKLAQENARYFVSVFSQTTSMVYTVSLRQLNYLLYMMENYIYNRDSSDFNDKLCICLKEFISYFDEYRVNDLIPKGKNRKLSLFGDERYFNTPDIFSYTYQTSFKASFSCMAQNQRHRSEHSFIYLLEDFEFYTPEIIEDDKDLMKEWLTDAKSIADMYPQGTLVKIVQTGNLDTLLLKSKERVCGQAQLEIMRHTVEIITKFKENSEFGYILEDETNNATAKCKFNHSTCSNACAFGSKQFERKI